MTVPEVSPVTIPPDVILAVPVPGVIDQVPPMVASVKAGVEEPTQTVADPPAMAAMVGSAFIVREVVAVLEQPPLMTV